MKQASTPADVAVKLRRMKFALGAGVPRHWARGNKFLTHFFNAMSVIFPEGERFFIDAVRHYEGQITDPELLEQVRGFVAQEGHHAFQHRALNELMSGHGVDMDKQDRWMRGFLQRLRSRLTPEEQLAITCALEHYTAMLADGVLRHPQWLAGAEPHMHTVWSWHAVEETEHKGVAFDAYRAAGGGYWRRVLWYVHVSLVFAFETFLQTLFNLHGDGQLFKLRTWGSALTFWFGRKGMAWHLARPTLDSQQPSFHPWQHDNRQLIESWLNHNDMAHGRVGRARPDHVSRQGWLG